MKKRLITTLFIFIGLMLITYPMFSQWRYSDIKGPIIEESIESFNALDQIAAATEWNKNLYRGIEQELSYDDVLNFGDGFMGRVQVPSIKVDLPIYHGVEESLDKGIGHLPLTSFPVGGESTHAVLSAHTGLASATMLTNLDKAKKGDHIILTIGGQAYSYKVFQIKVVLPHEIDSIQIEEGKDLLTLVTCTPYGINSHRLLVTGERLDPIPVEDGKVALEKPVKDFPWWMIIIVASITGGAMYIFLPSIFSKERKKHVE